MSDLFGEGGPDNWDIIRETLKKMSVPMGHTLIPFTQIYDNDSLDLMTSNITRRLPESRTARDFGNCPFPRMCNKRYTCYDEVGCNADVCSNGYTYRMS